MEGSIHCFVFFEVAMSKACKASDASMFDNYHLMEDMSDLSSSTTSPLKKSANVAERSLMEEVLETIVQHLHPHDRQQWLAFGKQFGAAEAGNDESYGLKVQTLCSGCDGAIDTLKDRSISMCCHEISVLHMSFYFVSAPHPVISSLTGKI